MNSDGDCQPDPSKLELTCGGDGLTIKISEEVVPDAVEVTLLDNCAGVYDSDSLGLTNMFKTLRTSLTI